MYQEQNYSPFSLTKKCIEKDSETLTRLFEEEYSVLENIDNREYDLSKKYLINWACLHNNPKFVGREGKIIQKNNKLALVLVDLEAGEYCTTIQAIYRLEDLSIIDY